MRILIAEDDPVSLLVLDRALRGWAHEVVVVSDGLEAWRVLQQPDAPKLAILDWMMPGMDGPEVCRNVRGLALKEPAYLILLTAKQQKEDAVAGLDSGADDFITKPFHFPELKSRVRAGERIVELQRAMALRVRELEDALAQIKQLKTLLPICSYCKKIRNDTNYWEQVDTYFLAHSDIRFSHGICPTCWDTVVQPQLDQMEQLEHSAD